MDNSIWNQAQYQWLRSPSCTLAYHLQKPLKEWLQQGVEEDIFEQVPENEEITSCSPLAIQPKPRFSKTPKEKLGSHAWSEQALTSESSINKHMKRIRIAQTPTVENFIHQFHDCSIWTKMDLRQGYTSYPSTQPPELSPLLPPHGEITAQND